MHQHRHKSRMEVTFRATAIPDNRQQKQMGLPQLARLSLPLNYIMAKPLSVLLQLKRAKGPWLQRWNMPALHYCLLRNTSLQTISQPLSFAARRASKRGNCNYTEKEKEKNNSITKISKNAFHLKIGLGV